MNLLITGGAGFIGSNVVRRVINSPEVNRLVNVDALTYAGHLVNLCDVSGHSKYMFEHMDLRDLRDLRRVVSQHEITHVIHLAAESHVDRSIDGPADCVSTNVIGTFNLLEACRETWAAQGEKWLSGCVDGWMGEGEEAKPSRGSRVEGRAPAGARCKVEGKRSTRPRFLHVSTDEVYGTLGATGYFSEATPYAPNSPYSASKASSDMLVRSYYQTYGLPVVITNCSNNYGPYQYPEKLIPVIIQKVVQRESVPVYGDGMNVRDWLYVEDHAEALWRVIRRGQVGETYNIGGHNEWPNIKVVEMICDLIDELHPDIGGNSRALIKFVKDRPGHDRRYAVDASKIEKELDWKPAHTFEDGLRATIRWYLQNGDWMQTVLGSDGIVRRGKGGLKERCTDGN